MYRLTEACDDPVQETVTPHIVGFDPADQAVPENIDSQAYAEAIQRKDAVGVSRVISRPWISEWLRYTLLATFIR